MAAKSETKVSNSDGTQQITTMVAAIKFNCMVECKNVFHEENRNLI